VKRGNIQHEDAQEGGTVKECYLLPAGTEGPGGANLQERKRKAIGKNVLAAIQLDNMTGKRIGLLLNGIGEKLRSYLTGPSSIHLRTE